MTSINDDTNGRINEPNENIRPITDDELKNVAGGYVNPNDLRTADDYSVFKFQLNDIVRY